MALATLQVEMKTGVEALRQIQADLQNNHRARQQFLQQQHENEMVLKELELLDEESKVYKLIGPALVRQDQLEATSTVKKRLEYIATELKRLDEKLVSLEEKANKRQAQLMELQNQAARIQHAAASG